MKETEKLFLKTKYIKKADHPLFIGVLKSKGNSNWK